MLSVAAVLTNVEAGARARGRFANNRRKRARARARASAHFCARMRAFGAAAVINAAAVVWDGRRRDFCAHVLTKNVGTLKTFNFCSHTSSLDARARGLRRSFAFAFVPIACQLIKTDEYIFSTSRTKMFDSVMRRQQSARELFDAF